MTVSLSVLLGGLVWVVWVGGLDVQPSISSGAESATYPGGASPSHEAAYKIPVDTPDTDTLLSSQADIPGRPQVFKGEVTDSMQKMAAAKRLTPEEITLAKSKAEDVVNEVLAKGDIIPPPNVEAVLPGSCNIMVEGFPLVQPKRQRCCKAKDLQGGGLPGQPPPLPPPEAWGSDAELGRGEELKLPGVLRTQTVGGIKEQEVVCFPSFIIAGTQKSGTTALTGILEKHPWVGMSMRKELHFFDTKMPSLSVVQSYAHNFPRFNASQAAEHRAPFVVGEATPFYFASRNACRHMRKLVPDVRLIILVRDPVKRAYSEYQMKKRRVEEELEIKELLANGGAKVVYDCAVQLFPSNPSNLTRREMYFLENPSSIPSAMSECAGRIGQHGKWMDLMLGVVRKLKGEAKVKSNPKSAETALKNFRTNMNRCFVLADVAESLDRSRPGGAWKANWNALAVKPNRGADLKGRPHDMKFPGGHPPMNRMPQAILKNRGLPTRVPQHRYLADTRHRAWNGTDAGEWGDSSVDWYSSDSDIFRMDIAGTGSENGESFVSEYADYSTDGVLEVGSESPLYGGLWSLREQEYLSHRLDEAYGDGAAAAVTEMYWKDYWGDRKEPLAPSEDAGSGDFWTPLEFTTGDGFVGAGDGEGFPPEGWDEEDSGAGFGRRLHGGNEVGRKLRPARMELPIATWGEWGQEGARIFDETCYMRHEEIVPVERVMRQELQTLTNCFRIALGEIGEDLKSLSRLDAVVAAKTLDDHLNKCFYVTPGISGQYIYRSLYGIQAHHCLRHFPREQIMFIESDELRDHPEKVLPRIHDHIGVPAYDYPSLGQDDIMAELYKMYPDFEKRTGWRLDSKYKEEMPADLAQEVDDFLKPHMQMFARLVGQSFGKWAIDDRDQQDVMKGSTERASELFEDEFDRQIAIISTRK